MIEIRITYKFPVKSPTEDDLWDKHNGKVPEGMIVMKDRIADNMLQQILTRTNEYDVLALPNLNGDYMSDACAAQVGGLRPEEVLAALRRAAAGK